LLCRYIGQFRAHWHRSQKTEVYYQV
jgi:hypothetical protein